jgi:hypothetical protein
LSPSKSWGLVVSGASGCGGGAAGVLVSQQGIAQCGGGRELGAEQGRHGAEDVVGLEAGLQHLQLEGWGRLAERLLFFGGQQPLADVADRVAEPGDTEPTPDDAEATLHQAGLVGRHGCSSLGALARRSGNQISRQGEKVIAPPPHCKVNPGISQLSCFNENVFISWFPVRWGAAARGSSHPTNPTCPRRRAPAPAPCQTSGLPHNASCPPP